MLNRLLPRSVRLARERHQETSKLAAIPSTPLDPTRLRTDIPDLSAFGQEWPEVERVMAAVALDDPRGGVNKGDRRLIYQLARTLNAKSVLEVGTHVGASTLMLALAMKRNGGKLTTVDIADVNAPDAYWRKFGCRQNPADTLRMANVSADFKQMDSVEWLKTDTSNYDLIFLDGLHEAQQLYRELPYALQRLNPGGLILLHDVFPDLQPLWDDGRVENGPWLALDRYRHEAAPVKVHPLGALPWPTKRNSNVTSLALVTA